MGSKRTGKRLGPQTPKKTKTPIPVKSARKSLSKRSPYKSKEKKRLNRLGSPKEVKGPASPVINGKKLEESPKRRKVNNKLKARKKRSASSDVMTLRSRTTKSPGTKKKRASSHGRMPVSRTKY